MKAIYMESASSYGLTERPMPEPRGDEVLVRVSHAGLCHTDVIIRSGKADHVLYPFIPGHEFSGVVEACGDLVYHLKPGDRVAMHSILGCGLCPSCHEGDICSCMHYDELGSRRDGGFAEYCSVPARWAMKLPENVSLEEGALAEPLANACAVVRNCRIQEGDRVVIIGPGPIGILAVQVALLQQPSSVVLLGTRDSRLEIGRKAGATHVVNIRHDGAMGQLDEILGGRGADVVMECAGVPDALEMAIEIAGRNGRVAIEGSMGNDETIRIYPRRVLVKALQLIGICGWRTEDFNRAICLMGASKVDVGLIITQHYGLDDWEQAFSMATTRKDESIKVEFSLS